MGTTSEVMIAVANCESGLRQYDTPNHVLRGKITPSDTGLFQISADYHEKTYRGKYDIFTLKGNIDYAKRLYSEQGMKPWSASKSCWSKSVKET